VERLFLQIDSHARDFRRFRLLLLSLAIAGSLVPGRAVAGQYGVRVRWAPSPSPDVVGYEVYRRTVPGSYGAAEPGIPSSSDGVLSLVVANLDVQTDYAFEVRAVAASGSSALSNELQIGYSDVAPLLDSDGDGLTDAAEDVNLNRLVDAGESNPDLADSDADGVGDLEDACEGTVPGDIVGAIGCACAQLTCDDGDVCNGAEACTAGVCGPGTAPSCDDGNACTTDDCEPATGCRHAAVSGCSSCASAAECDDGNACNGLETCEAGVCHTGPAPVCTSDGNPCTTESCDPLTGCGSRAVADGASCGDGNACNGAELCGGGACQPGTPLACDDANTCTIDTCDAVGGCAHRTLGDGAPCASDSGFCAGTDVCLAGTCVVGTPPSCDDTNTCSVDSCDDVLGRCAHEALAGCCQSDEDCADSDVCTTQERCVQGTCVSTPLACPDPGSCGASRCDAAAGCLTVPLADGTPCDDGDACSVGEACTSGQCATGVPRTCPDPGPCAVGRCDAVSGCISDPLPDGTPCDDGDACPRREVCQAGVCGRRFDRSSETGVTLEEPGVTLDEPDLTVERFTVRSLGGRGQRLRGRARLSSGTVLLPGADLTIAIEDSAGIVLYRADLPASALVTDLTPKGGRIRLRSPFDSRLRRLVLRVRGEHARLAFTIAGEALVPPETAGIALKVRGGNGCGHVTAAGGG
jgi:hypothetical protein